jgi:hypothetical protein
MPPLVPEALHVFAEPRDASTFVALSNFFDRIQAELDGAWAALGEVFGLQRRTGLDQWSLVVRRIRHNLGAAEFQERLPYVPRAVACGVAPSLLLPLLTTPLYGRRPEVGIRELIQNSVDAVRELEKHRNASRGVALDSNVPKGADVTVHLHTDTDGRRWLTVADRGIGMTVDTACDYFLRAGSTFRDSETWRSQFLNPDGQPAVLRSGRFGVGVLAGFLLGDRIRVSTRHAADSRGFEFTVQLSAERVELVWCDRPVGTTVEIEVSEQVYEQLAKAPQDWDWFRYDLPRVQRSIEGKILAQAVSVPMPGEEPRGAWRRFVADDGVEVFWGTRNSPGVVCNGLVIEGHYAVPPWLWSGSLGYDIAFPHLSLVDWHGVLPINLVRDKLDREHCSFREELLKEVIKDFVAYAFVSAPTDWTWGPRTKTFHIPGGDMCHFERSFRHWLLTQQGTTIFDPWHLRTIGCRTVCFVPAAWDVTFGPGEPLWRENCLAIISSEGAPHMLGMWLTPGTVNGIPVVGARLLVHRRAWETRNMFSEADAFLGHRRVADDTDAARVEWSQDDWILVAAGTCGDALCDFERAIAHGGQTLGKRVVLAGEWALGDLPAELSPTAEAWRRYLGTPIVPYGVDQRGRSVPREHHELSEYVERWRGHTGRR